MPHVPCPACNRMLNMPDAALGKGVSCPACKHRFTAPGGPEQPAEPAAALVEEPVARPPAGAAPPEPAASPKKKKRKKNKSPAGRLGRRGLLVAAAVGGVGLLAGGWLLLGGGGGGGGPSPAREPKGGTAYAHTIPPADRASWKVAAEAADPPPAGIRPVVACPGLVSGDYIITLAFADPKAATAAVVLRRRSGGKGAPWWQVSLTEPAGTKVVPLIDPVRGNDLPYQHGEVALSPSGDRLATAFDGQHEKDSFGVALWDRDGRKVGEWAEGKVADRPRRGERVIRGLWFASADRLLVLRSDTLVCREVATGKLVYQRPLKLAGDAVLTPRRTWLLAGVPDGVEAIATADGSTAGRLTVPGFQPAGGIRLAVSPDGKRLAALASCDTGVPLVVWTLADGKPAYARYYDPQLKWLAGTGRPALPSPLHWAGDRQLVIAGRAVFDLDLGGLTYTFGETADATPSGAIPDGRVWRLLTVPNAPGMKLPVGGNFLAATAVPALPGGLVLGPHTSFRVTAEGASGSTAVVREALADALADRGYRVDPAADLTVHFEGGKVNRIRVGGREVLNPKWNQRPPNGWVLVEMVDAYEVSYGVSIRDRQGRLVRQGNNRGCTAIDFEEKGPVVGWTRAAREAAGIVPEGLVILVPDGPSVNLPLKAASQEDGTAEVLSGR